MIIVIGAGLAGMSAAYHLAERGIEHVVYEKERQPGGLCQSYIKRNHTFDLAGHFLHLRTDDIKKFVKKIMPEGISLKERSASIIVGDCKVPFPFQAHVGFLPKEDVVACLTGYINAILDKRETREKTLGKWLAANFGLGMYERFFRPYNEKFWKMDLDDILVDWTQWSVPRPDVEQVVRGAMGIESKGMGYNPSFYYPDVGGIGAFTTDLANRLKNIKTGMMAHEIEAKKHRVVLSDRSEIEYDALINTQPVPRLFGIMKDAPGSLKRAAVKLDWIVVDCVQLGFKRQNIIEEDWIYVPDEKYPFYRVGKYPGGVGDSGSAIFVEFTRRKNEPMPNPEDLIKTTMEGLTDLKIIEKREKANIADIVSLNPAYVVYDKHRQWFLPRAEVFLKRHDIHSIGRYGTWEYSTMEDALIQGKNIAESLA